MNLSNAGTIGRGVNFSRLLSSFVKFAIGAVTVSFLTVSTAFALYFFPQAPASPSTIIYTLRIYRPAANESRMPVVDSDRFLGSDEDDFVIPLR